MSTLDFDNLTRFIKKNETKFYGNVTSVEVVKNIVTVKRKYIPGFMNEFP